MEDLCRPFQNECQQYECQQLYQSHQKDLEGSKKALEDRLNAWLFGA